ncbi:MAG: DUF1572 family protein [Pyrinomonadaceae bacterium]|nr:DUF1572 family protein [Pyrinomonadaceae bacterium]
MTNDTATSFVAEARKYLFDVYLPRVERCVEELTDEQIWWRPNEQSNSIGNLLLHLAGSTRMWIVSGVGGKAVERDRQAEFDERSIVPRQELLMLLKNSLREADEVLANYDASKLQELHRVKDDTVTSLEALFHAVEHFAMHAGQIMLLTKIITSRDLRLYE